MADVNSLHIRKIKIYQRIPGDSTWVQSTELRFDVKGRSTRQVFTYADKGRRIKRIKYRSNKRITRECYHAPALSSSLQAYKGHRLYCSRTTEWYDKRGRLVKTVVHARRPDGIRRFHWLPKKCTVYYSYTATGKPESQITIYDKKWADNGIETDSFFYTNEDSLVRKETWSNGSLNSRSLFAYKDSWTVEQRFFCRYDSLSTKADWLFLGLDSFLHSDKKEILIKRNSKNELLYWYTSWIDSTGSYVTESRSIGPDQVISYTRTMTQKMDPGASWVRGEEYINNRLSLEIRQHYSYWGKRNTTGHGKKHP